MDKRVLLWIIMSEQTWETRKGLVMRLLSTRGRHRPMTWCLQHCQYVLFFLFISSVALLILFGLFTILGISFSVVLLCLCIVYCYQHCFISPELTRSISRVWYAKTCCELCSRFSVAITFRSRDIMPFSKIPFFFFDFHCGLMIFYNDVSICLRKRRLRTYCRHISLNYVRVLVVKCKHLKGYTTGENAFVYMYKLFHNLL